MIKFAIYSRLTITEKPEWLDTFMSKYIKPFEIHVTLKQPCYIDKSQEPEVLNILKGILESEINKKVIPLSFGAYKLDFHPTTESDQSTIMVLAEEDQHLMSLQQEIIEKLSDYNNYCKPENEKFEINFEPHITIGDELHYEEYQQAISELPEKVTIKGTMDEIVLILVDTESGEEIKNSFTLG
ncbi:MAG: 2'-5' RNA ligase family protein [bacterium]